MKAQANDGRLVASLSLDLDNLWSYLKIHGESSWQSLPTYLPVVVPRLLDYFASFEIFGTVFVVGQDTEVEENDEAIRAIAEAGHEIGNHSFSHEPWLHTFSRSQLTDELARTEEGLQRLTGRKPEGFRGPGYSFSETLFDVLTERGYAYDASTLPTWIGPLARAYYFRSAELGPDERRRRAQLFGRAQDGLLPVHPYHWSGDDTALVELPVTTLPLLRVPMHFSYVLYLHSVSPWLARRYFVAALRMCELRGLGPSLLLHPLDLLDSSDAPGVGFFPGMGLSATQKRNVIDWCTAQLVERFDVGGTGEHVTALTGGGTRTITAHE